VVLYNVPGRTGLNMTAETTLKLAETVNIVAVKEASGNMDQVFEIIRNSPEGFVTLSGNDDNTFEMMSAGGAGVISVASNIAPELLVRLTRLLEEKRFDQAGDLNRRLMPLFKNCFVESNPIPVKGGLYCMGLISNVLRLPLTAALPQTLDIMKSTIENLKTI
ncbi:MAG: dihydrodipicolinate synthase family protein, partial [Bacteroidales bacterium]|nr:dihydrodipicolinate synthase family protein [Bacteroidales bacterium]